MLHIITLNNANRTTYETRAPYWQALRSARMIAAATGALSFSIRAIVPQA